MMGNEAHEVKAVSISDIVEILEERKKSGELTYEQQIALEHAKKFAQSKVHVSKLKAALEGLSVLSPNSVLKIIEIAPKNAMLIRQILAQEKKRFSDDEVNKILAITKEKG
jgi:DNA-directed RNA polymerase subunit F